MADRTQKQRLSREEAIFFASFIDSGECLTAAENIGSLSVVQKRLINKSGTDKKRVVYSFSPGENAVLKVIAHLCYRYDAHMPANLYSFRRDSSAKTAVRRIVSARGIDNMYAYKLDIRDYFNSIDPRLLLAGLRTLLTDDAPLYAFFYNMLTADTAMFDGALVHEQRGVMAGTPTSPFLANVYLLPLDRYFERRGALYARYSDDIILFANTPEELSADRTAIRQMLEEHRLEINAEKEAVALPHETWTFLGISYTNGAVDLSENTKRKLKGKIRRKARALYRWKLRKGESDERAIRAFIRSINRKLYERPDDAHRFSWTRWFFPLVTVADGLHEMDEYLVQYMRYVAYGGFGRSGYRLRYETLKGYGFRPLVAAYYRYKKEP